MGKENIISKINIKDYNRILEEILTQKSFPETTKNILISMLYKIENSYLDYKKVKVYALPKKDILEEVIYLIEVCNDIEILIPKDKDVDLNKCKVITEEKKIVAYPNEKAILYSLYQLQDEKYDIPKRYKIIKPSLEKMLNTGRAINLSEIIRDFDGWSWNINRLNKEDTFCNFIYQTLNLLVDIENLSRTEFIKELETELKDKNTQITINRLFKRLYQLSIIYNIEKEMKERERLILIYEKAKKDLETISNKKVYLEEITKNKKELQKELARIQKILSNPMILKQEYIETNRNLETKNRIFSLSDFSEIQEQRKKEMLEQIKENNKKQDPNNYIKEKKKLEDKVNFLEEINLQNTEENKKAIIIDFIKISLKILTSNLKAAETKKQIIDIIYKLRYYRKIITPKMNKLEDIKEIIKKLEEVEKEAITKACNFRVINIISLDLTENYEIIRNIINIGIIDLENIYVEIKKKENMLIIDIYEDKSLEKTITDFNIKDLNIKLNKKIKLFV